MKIDFSFINFINVLFSSINWKSHHQFIISSQNKIKLTSVIIEKYLFDIIYDYIDFYDSSQQRYSLIWTCLEILNHIDISSFEKFIELITNLISFLGEKLKILMNSKKLTEKNFHFKRKLSAIKHLIASCIDSLVFQYQSRPSDLINYFDNIFKILMLYTSNIHILRKVYRYLELVSRYKLFLFLFLKKNSNNDNYYLLDLLKQI